MMRVVVVPVVVLLVGACAGKQVRPSQPAEAAAPAPAPKLAASAPAPAPEPEPQPEPAPVVEKPAAEAAGMPVIRFDYDSAILSDEARASLEALAKSLAREESLRLKGKGAKRLVVEGHADERGTEEYNQVLSQQRADTVRKYLTRSGINAKLMDTIAYGWHRPAVAGVGEDAWSRNRRAEFKLLPAEQVSALRAKVSRSRGRVRPAGTR